MKWKLQNILLLLIFLSSHVFLFTQNKQSIIDSLKLKLRTPQPDSTRVELLNRISYLYFTIDPSEGIRYGEESILLAKNINWEKGLANAYRSLGSNYWSKKDIAKAQDFFWNALKIYEKINDKASLARSIHSLGVLYQTVHMYSKALEHFEIAATNLLEIGDSNAVAGCLANIANIYQMINNKEKAIEYYLKSLQMAKSLNNNSMIAYYNSSLGVVYAELGHLENAMISEKNALTFYESINDSFHMAGVKREIGNIFHKQTNYDSALFYYQHALRIFEKIKGLEGIASQADLYSNIGKLYKSRVAVTSKFERIKLLQKASEYQKTAIELILPFKIWELLKEYYKELSDVEYQRNNKESSLYYYKQYSAMKDSLYNIDKATEMSRHELQYEFEKKEQKLKSDQQIILSDSKNKNTMIILFSLLIVLSILIITIFLRQKNMKKRAIEKANAAHKMSELELQSLRAQLNPHFMFNSLNAIQELIVTDKTELSQSYLERFAKLLRLLLENASQSFIPLRKEINFLELYLSLENLRIPDLKYSIEIDPDVNTETTVTPNMMLQPYIENALWHGLQHKQGEKKLQLFISRENGSLNYEIKDNGVGRKKAEELKSLYRREHRSKGMELLSKRFALLSKEYGQDIQTTVTDLSENGDATGTVVKITVPFSLSKIKQGLQ